METKAFLTIQQSASCESTIERSRFIGHCREVATEAEAKSFIAEIRELHAQATHNCYAYRIGSGENPIEYYNDHGEPSGTAGKPILGAIQRLNLTNVVVVVTRYFGGKKLGIRGLIEAYGHLASMALAQAGVITRIPKFEVVLTYNYSNHSLILHRLQQVSAELLATEYTDLVMATFAVPVEQANAFADLINELPILKLIKQNGF